MPEFGSLCFTEKAGEKKGGDLSPGRSEISGAEKFGGRENVGRANQRDNWIPIKPLLT